MASRQPIATRQELLKLKAKTKNAQRGRSLLKDKRDSLMKEFFDIMREAIELRQRFEDMYGVAFGQFQQAISQMDHEYLEALTKTVTVKVNVTATTKSIMSVKIPQLSSSVEGSATEYSLIQTNAQLDQSLQSLRSIIPDILALIQAEYAALLLAREIEKTRRRVNSLDYIVIPELQAHTKGVRSKLEEQARDATVALMKVKAKIV
jgi:V/A-type H+/Na+-transporting ATPase subunit D